MSGDASRLAVLKRAEALAGAQSWAAAIALCDEALASDGESAAAWNLKGFCLRALGRKEESLSAFKRARLHLPVYAPIRYNLGTALRENGDLKGALAEFEEALKLDPADLQARLSRAVVKLDLGDEAGARADFDGCLRRDPALLDGPALDAAEAFASEGRWTEALFVARKVLERAAKSARAWSIAGRALAGLDKAQEAERSLDEALLLAPEDAPALSARAALRLRRKDETGALRDLEAMLKVLPAGPERDALLKEARILRGETP